MKFKTFDHRRRNNTFSSLCICVQCKPNSQCINPYLCFPDALSFAWSVLHVAKMHYVRGPPNDDVLSPVPQILDCEFRDWITDLCFRLYVGNDASSITAARKANDLLLLLTGCSGRNFWIAGHDSWTFFGTVFEQVDVFLDALIHHFDISFWEAIPRSDNLQLDNQQKEDRWGYS